MKKPLAKLTQFLTAIILIVLTLITGLFTPINVYADSEAVSSNAFDNTDPIADLSGDESFDITNYPFKSNGKIVLASFNEYCYSFYSEKKSNFAIYIYVYNPAALNIVDSSLNRIQMAVGYDGDGKPNDYEKFELKLCSVSGGDYARLFYKFKVVDHLTNGLSIYDRLNSNRRRYDVSGIELISDDAVNATETGISRTYFFTGYAAGYGPDYSTPESTLKCEYENLETVELDVKHTFWRSSTSNKGPGYQNQLDSVYFSIPNRFLREYGKLQRIKAEWYEYLTKDIIVTSNQDFYNDAKNYIGQAVNADVLNWTLEENPQTEGSVVSSERKASWAYNKDNDLNAEISIDTLYYLFPTANWGDIDNYTVSEDELYNYILNYDKTNTNGSIQLKNGKISADLFENDIDENRKINNEYGKIQYGYSYYDFDADADLFDLISYQPGEHSFSENRSAYNLFQAIFGGYSIENSFTNISPILLLNKDEYFQGSNQDVADKLFINVQDVDEIKATVSKATKEDETVVLFRFARSDYYANKVFVNTKNNFINVGLKKAYRAQESVFLDFDIIQLTFNKDGEYIVIPVVSSPIDIVDDITPPYTPPSTNKLLAWIVFIAAVAGGFFLIYFGSKIGYITVKSELHLIFKIWIIAFILAVLFTVGYLVAPLVIKTITGLGGL